MDNRKKYSIDNIQEKSIGDMITNMTYRDTSSSSGSGSGSGSGSYSDAAVSEAKSAVASQIPQDGLYGQAAASAVNNMEVGADGVSFNYEGMASDMLASNEYTSGIADAMNSPVGQCAIGAAKVYAGFYTGNPQMMYNGAKQIYDNYEGAIQQIKDSPVGKAASSFCDGLNKLGKSCQGCCNKLKNILENDKREVDEQVNKKKGGGCSGKSNKGGQCSNSVPLNAQGDVDADDANDVDKSINKMCKKVYTIYRPIPKDVSCPITQRDNVSDQTTPQDDLLVMEKTVRDFLKIEEKIYDAETTNPRFFASEDWVQHYEKDKNVILASLDQFKANTVRMEHLYTMVDKGSLEKLISIPNQDCKSTFQTDIVWTAQALKNWINRWFIDKTNSFCTDLWDDSHWMPGETGQMIDWMKLGSYSEFNMRPIAIETMISKVDRLESVIDRLMNKEAVEQTISRYLNMKEILEQSADQKNENVFTSKIVDSTMGKKLGVVVGGCTTEKMSGPSLKAPSEDDVEKINLKCNLSCVKKLFNELRAKSLDTLMKCRCVCASGPGPYSQIWTRIDDYASIVYGDLAKLNDLIQDLKHDHENPGWHCEVTHTKLCPKQLKKKITSFKCVIKSGVLDIMVNQAMLPKKGLNILDSMFNQMWEYGEKGPGTGMPSWCQEAIMSIEEFEDSLLDAWDEVFDCWEREFLTRLWRIEVEHHTNNWRRIQTNTNTTMHDHIHDNGGTHGSPTSPSSVGDAAFHDTSYVHGYLCCPGHLPDLLKPVCVCYKIDDIQPLAQNFRADVKRLCQWMISAIQAVGMKQSTISAVMADPTLNGNCCNVKWLKMINELKEKNNKLLQKAEKAYGIYMDVTNLKNKVQWDKELALQELQPSKYSNEDQLNMTSSIQTESNQTDLSSELCQGGIDIAELKPWNHLDLSVNKVKPKCIPSKCVCNKFGKTIKSIANFESQMNLES